MQETTPNMNEFSEKEKVYVSEFTDTVRKAFAKVSHNTGIIDLTTLVGTSSQFSKEQILTAIENQDTEDLISMSNYFYNISGEYRQLIEKVSALHKFRNVVYPVYIQKKAKKIDKANEKVMDYVYKCKIEETSRTIAFYALLNGACYSYEIMDGNETISTIVLPSSYCRTTSYDMFGCRTVDFNFQLFDTISDQAERDEILKSLPKEFSSLYKNYLGKKSNIKGNVNETHWQRLDSTLSRCTSFNENLTPFFVAVLLDLIDYEEYKNINKKLSELDLVKVLTQKVEFNKNEELIVDDETISALHKNLVKVARSSGTGALTSPFSIESLTLNDKSDKNLEYISNGLSNVYNSASLPESAFNSNGKNSGAIGITSSNKLLNGIFTSFISQLKSWYRKKFNELNGSSAVFDIKFLDITGLNEEEKIVHYKEQFTMGGSALEYFSAIGINQIEINSVLQYEEMLGIKDRLIPPQSTFTTTGDDKGGRPEKKADEKSDVSIKQDDKGTKESRSNNE